MNKEQAQLDANLFLASMKPYPDTNLYASADDGEFIVNWRSDAFFVECSFEGNGTYSYYARVGNDEFFGDDIPCKEPLPDNLRSAIAQPKESEANGAA